LQVKAKTVRSNGIHEYEVVGLSEDDERHALLHNLLKRCEWPTLFFKDTVHAGRLNQKSHVGDVCDYVGNTRALPVM
jgi:hypothetical protein